jgi:LmbE family N-acetylglucosaminyl deacetylase
MDNLGGIGFHPNEYVDIMATMAVKHRMLACHKSQLPQ